MNDVDCIIEQGADGKTRFTCRLKEQDSVRSRKSEDFTVIEMEEEIEDKSPLYQLKHVSSFAGRANCDRILT